MKYADYLAKVPQTQPLAGEEMVVNNAGGYVFQLDCWARLKRFLVLGSDGGTFYVKERALTLDNAKVVSDCIQKDPGRLAKELVVTSNEGLAPRQNATIFALAMLCAAEPNSAAHGYKVVASVCRTGTHLFQFVDSVKKLRGVSGRGLLRALSRWYTDKPVDKLAYQLLKYKNREGWSHKDVLRLAHPKPTSTAHSDLLGWVVGKVTDPDKLPSQVVASATAHVLQAEGASGGVVKLVLEHRLTHEMLPSESLKESAVWDALLHDMPAGALLRNLGRMTSLGVLKEGAAAAAYVADLLQNEDVLKKARLHPLHILNALRVYAKGKGDKGSLTWKPVKQVEAALDKAFYKAFKTVEPTGKKFCLGIDVSGSMHMAKLAGYEITAAEAAAVMALVTYMVEPHCSMVAFSTALAHLKVPKDITIQQFVEDLSKIPMGGTDCALPILAAQQNRWPVDCFVVLTDSETWFGKVHPVTALRQYRLRTQPGAKLVVVGMTSTGFTIADPNDAGTLDVVGFSTDVPQVISQFAKG